MRQQGFYAIDEVLRRESYKLLCFVLAKYEFEKYQYAYGAPDIFEAIESEQTELNTSIMALAALARANDDSGEGLTEYRKSENSSVGSLVIEGTKSVPLSSREACNKIIHSTSAEWSLKETKDHPLYADNYKERKILSDYIYKEPILLLSGKNGNKFWNAEVNIIQWVASVAGWGAN